VVNATGSGALEYQLNTGAFQTSNTFNGLAPGNYNITVRSQSNPGCITIYSSNPVVINPVPVAPTVNTPTITQPTCAIPSGSILVNAAGSGALEYQLNTGAFQTSNSFSGLIPGNYNISVRLQNNPSCITSYSGNPVVINPVPVAPTVNAPTVTQPSCTTPAGAIVVNATGSGTLEYQLNAGGFQTANTFNGLTPGNYNISVRLQNNPTCISNYSNNPVVINAVPVSPTISCPGNITQNNSLGQCGRSVIYTVTTTGTAPVTVTYNFTGATIGSGIGDGSGLFFNVGTTTVNVSVTNACGSAN
jgi:hypothetical protein